MANAHSGISFNRNYTIIFITHNESGIPNFPTYCAVFTGVRFPHTSLSWSIWYPGKRLLTSASLISAIAVRVGRLSLLLRL